MKLERVPYATLRPDPNNPRQDFGDLEALAQSFQLNALYPGEPVNPPVVVQDGNVYRIVDGERRWRAMGTNEIEDCNVVVCDDMDEANAMVAMVATDDKQQLTDIERSRGVQQMLMLGVDEETAEKLGHLKHGQGAKVRRARKRIEDKADQLSLEHLVAIAEAEERGDDKAVKAISALSSHEKENRWDSRFKWECIAEKHKRCHETIAVYDELVEKAKTLYIDVHAKDPDKDAPRKRVSSLYLSAVNAGDGHVDEFLENAEEGCFIICKKPTLNDYRINAVIYISLEGIEETEEEKAERIKQERIDQICQDYKNAQERRIKWVGALLVSEDIHRLKNTMEFFLGDEYVETYDIEYFAENAEVDANRIERWTSPHIVAGHWDEADDLDSWVIKSVIGGDNLSSWYEKNLSKYIGLMEALVADGYEMSEDEQELLELCRKALANTEGGA